MQKLTLPDGERIGQIIYNALEADFSSRRKEEMSTGNFVRKLYNIENDRLQEIINKYKK